QNSGFMNDFANTAGPSDYNYTTGASAGGYFVAANPVPGNDPSGPNPEQPYFSYESGDGTVRVSMDGPPDSSSISMDTFLETCFPDGGANQAAAENCPETVSGRMEQGLRTTSEIVSHMDEVFPAEIIADPYKDLGVTDRDEFLDPIIAITMQGMDKMDGKID